MNLRVIFRGSFADVNNYVFYIRAPSIQATVRARDCLLKNTKLNRLNSKDGKVEEIRQ